VDDHDGGERRRAVAAARREERADERQPVAGSEGLLGFGDPVGSRRLLLGSGRYRVVDGYLTRKDGSEDEASFVMAEEGRQDSPR
jgi:hypothetical protein